ncbi:MAG: right-handed parallel beta-helix repeat-containing protein, partial [Pyrinomonadaceae bacterium]
TNGDPWITVRCVSTIPGAIGVEIASGNTVLKGLKFSDADFYALRLSGGGANSIVSNVFSADTNAGDPANSLPLLIGSNGNTIGGPSPIDKNSFLGNQEGVWVLAGGPNTVWGNDILSASEDGGILAFGTNTNLLIKDNLISDNAAISVGGAGIQVVNGFATTIQGNKIGTNSAGNAALGVQNNGIHMIGGSNHLIGGPSPAARNIISGNIQSGIRLVTDASTIQNNYIGLSVNGLNSIPNDMGVTISNFARSQFANEATGTRRALGRNFVGVDSGDLTVSNYISGNSHFGIFFDNDWYGALTYVQGNVIGLTRSGGGGQGNGGSKTGTGGGVGGIVSTGTVKVGGSTSSPNVISANRGNGVYLSGPNVRGFDISNNYIGTDPLGGNGNVGNQLNGIRIEAFSGAHTAKANRIAYNGGNGINIDLDSSNLFQGHSTAISGNEIFNNGCAACVPFNDSGSFNVGTLIGIDVGDNGTSTNNPGDGIQDYPVVTSAAVAGNIVTVNGTFSSSTDNYELQFFLTATPCVNNISQSLSFFIGSKLDRFGTFTSFSYQFPMPTGITGGYVQATAINRHLRIFRYQPTELLKRPQGNSSSEYSPCVAAN